MCACMYVDEGEERGGGCVCSSQTISFTKLADHSPWFGGRCGSSCSAVLFYAARFTTIQPASCIPIYPQGEVKLEYDFLALCDIFSSALPALHFGNEAAAHFSCLDTVLELFVLRSSSVQCNRSVGLVVAV